MESYVKNVGYLPKSHRIFLDNLFVGKEKSVPLASIRLAIMQQVRSKALIVPLQLGLGIQMHQHFASRLLIDWLNKHGFCVSYSEVLKYEHCAAVHQGTKIPGVSESSSAEPTHFSHHVLDNAGHNSRTLDVCNTFHVMGIMCSVTPAVSSSFIPRLEDLSTEDLIKLTEIEQQISPSARKPLKLKLIELNKPVNAFDRLSSTWAATWLLDPRQPLWSGYIQTVNTGNYPGRVSTFFMLMIDLKSTDLVCILSTMHFVTEQSSKYNMTPVLTFDQPLYWKSMFINEQQHESSALKKIVLKIGGFHQIMSLLGSIGYIIRKDLGYRRHLNWFKLKGR